MEGIGGGIVLGLMEFRVFRLFPGEEGGFGMGLGGVVVESGGGIGGRLSGLLVDLFSWRMGFYVV
nr:hypothetical protein [Staphylococcus epidermidis]